MIRLFIIVEDPSAVMTNAGYTHIRVYTDTSATGNFTTLDGTVTLVSGQVSYEYVDTDGTADTWYETAYYSVASGEGDKTAARKGETSAAYATVLELRNDGRVDIDSRTSDVGLASLLDAATRAIDRTCKRPDGFVADVTASARYYPGSGTYYQWIDECTAVTAVAVKDSVADDEDSYTSWTVGTVGSTTSADVFPASGSPEDPSFNRTPYTLLVIGANGDYDHFTSGRYAGRRGFRPVSTVARGVPTVSVTANWGYASTVPADIREACVMQAARWYKRLQSAMADAVAGPDFGQLLYRRNLDPEVAQILIGGGYVRAAIGRRH